MDPEIIEHSKPHNLCHSIMKVHNLYVGCKTLYVSACGSECINACMRAYVFMYMYNILYMYIPAHIHGRTHVRAICNNLF